MACLETLALANSKDYSASDCLTIVRNINEMPLCAYMTMVKGIQERAKIL